jgi:sulfopyruvate decarboxylase TPP-binding subunit
MRGDEGEWNSAQMPMGRAVRAILDSIRVGHVTARSADATRDAVNRAAMQAFASNLPCACLLPKLLTAEASRR